MNEYEILKRRADLSAELCKQYQYEVNELRQKLARAEEDCKSLKVLLTLALKDSGKSLVVRYDDIAETTPRITLSSNISGDMIIQFGLR